MDQAQFESNVKRYASMIELNPNKIEWEDIRESLTWAAANKEKLSRFANADTIMFLIEALAATGAYMQYSIDVAWGEGNLTTARLPESILAIIRTLGVRMTRKSPTKIQVMLKRPTATTELIVPSFSTFTVNNVTLFNREDVVFAVGESAKTVVLCEGYIADHTQLINQPQPYSKFWSEESAFTVSDTDVKVWINNDPIEVSRYPIWHFRNVSDGNIVTVNNIVSDFTLSDGSLELQFGNERFGRMAQFNDTIRIRYAVTQGAVMRTVPIGGAKVKGIEYPSLEGTALSGFYEGSNEIDAFTYREVGPLMFASQNKAVDDAGYKAVPIEYPGVVDSKAIRQAFYAPGDVRYANFIKMSLLTNGAISDEYWDGFEAFMLENGLKTGKILRADPQPIDVTVDADVYVPQNVDMTQAKARIELAVTNLFRPRYGILGLDIFKSDIIETITNAVSGINFVDLISPRTNLYMGPKKLTTLSVVQSADGDMPAGNFQYKASFTAYGDESLPVLLMDELNGTSMFVSETDGNAFTVTINPLFYGETINLYRTHIALNGAVTVRRILSQPIVFGETITFKDGAFNAGIEASPLHVDLSGVRYPRLTDLTINMKLTDRRFLLDRRSVR